MVMRSIICQYTSSAGGLHLFSWRGGDLDLGADDFLLHNDRKMSNALPQLGELEDFLAQFVFFPRRVFVQRVEQLLEGANQFIVRRGTQVGRFADGRDNLLESLQ
jgi:hypothetical protein